MVSSLVSLQEVNHNSKRMQLDFNKSPLNTLPIELISQLSSYMCAKSLGNLAGVSHFYCVVSVEQAICLQNTINHEFEQIFPEDLKNEAMNKFSRLFSQINPLYLPENETQKSSAEFFTQLDSPQKRVWLVMNKKTFEDSYRFLSKYEVMTHRIAGDFLDCLHDNIDIDKPHLALLKQPKNNALDTQAKILDAKAVLNWEELVSMSETLVQEGRLEEGVLTLLSISDENVQKEHLNPILDEALANTADDDDRIVGLMALLPDRDWYLELKKIRVNDFLCEELYSLAEAVIETCSKQAREDFLHHCALFYYQKEMNERAIYIAKKLPPARSIIVTHQIISQLFPRERQLVTSINELLTSPTGDGGIRANATALMMSILDMEKRTEMAQRIESAWPSNPADDDLSDLIEDEGDEGDLSLDEGDFDEADRQEREIPS